MLSYIEFLVFLGIWFFMATIIGPILKEWFLSLPVDQFDGVPYRISSSKCEFSSFLLPSLDWQIQHPSCDRIPPVQTKQDTSQVWSFHQTWCQQPKDVDIPHPPHDSLQVTEGSETSGFVLSAPLLSRCLVVADTVSTWLSIVLPLGLALEKVNDGRDSVDNAFVAVLKFSRGWDGPLPTNQRK